MRTTQQPHTVHASRELFVFLAALGGREPTGGLLELRYRRDGGGMGQEFHPAGQPARAARAITRLGRETDVYVGVAPRRRHVGAKNAIDRAWTLWADCDGPDALDRLQRFAPAPALVVSSGSAGHVHAYWPLRDPIGVGELEHANRRLAHALGADTGAVTNAAAILRPPGTLNFKSEPPALVRLEHPKRRRFDLHDVLDQVPELARPEPPASRAVRSPVDAGDPLRALDPAVYVEALTGQTVGRSRKVSCPFHTDTTPSLHVYATADGGWYCFGCRRGTSVYDLAGPLWGLQTRGREFGELRRRLYDLLMPNMPAALDPSARMRPRAGSEG